MEANQLIKNACEERCRYFADMGFNAVYEQPTHNFDSRHLLSTWSHKHIAYVCGLGSFGRNTMLITAGGCAGRFVPATDAYLESSAQAALYTIRLRKGVITVPASRFGSERRGLARPLATGAS